MDILIKLFITAILFAFGFLGCLIFPSGTESKRVVIASKGIVASFGCAFAIAVLIVWAV